MLSSQEPDTLETDVVQTQGQGCRVTRAHWAFLHGIEKKTGSSGAPVLMTVQESSH